MSSARLDCGREYPETAADGKVLFVSVAVVVVQWGNSRQDVSD